MRIKQLSARTGASADTIRDDEHVGLLPPPARGDNSYRTYKEQPVERLAFIRSSVHPFIRSSVHPFIRRARELDMSLQEIRTLMQWHDRPQSNYSAVDALIDAHIAHIRSLVRELRTLERGSTLVAAPEPQPHVAGAHERPRRASRPATSGWRKMTTTPPCAEQANLPHGVHPAR